MKTSKPAKRSLVEAQASAAEESLAAERSRVERAILVAVEFTGARRRLTSVAQARRPQLFLQPELTGRRMSKPLLIGQVLPILSTWTLRLLWSNLRSWLEVQALRSPRP